MSNSVTKRFWRQGEPYVWGTGLALTLVLMLTVLLIYVVIINGIGVFWPKAVAEVQLTSGSKIMGEITRQELIPNSEKERVQFKIGNRDLYSLDFKWVDAENMASLSYPENMYVLERQEYGNFYGYLKSIATKDLALPQQIDGTNSLEEALEAVEPLHDEVEVLNEQITDLNHTVERIELKLRELRYTNKADSPQAHELEREEAELKDQFAAIVKTLEEKRNAFHSHKALFVDTNGIEKSITLAEIVRSYQPNAMSLPAKIIYYAERLRELFLDEPRESNTEGGLFPAIFGTIMLIFLMSILSFPLGVVGGIYLREYAKDGVLVKMVRIAVNNLAGIPSIVYGIFGLGFFVYGIGGSIDTFFFPERLPTPTFGTGGILWASLTLGLLTVPVVIVATEEALGAIPPGIREGSQALAATKFQTLTKLLLPMASPGILTGFILAMARAAGEVAPLMITGVVKLAPALPIDGQFPYLHLDRKFMHLGFHIYDIGFQSPNVEAAKPMVYVTTFLLIMIVLIMTSTAIYLRNRMRRRYSVVDV